MNCFMKDVCIKPPLFFCSFIFMKLERKELCFMDCLFVLFNDPEKDIKVQPVIRSPGFNEPKKLNAHNLSNFIESGKNLRKTPTCRFFVVQSKRSEKVVNLYRQDANSNPFTSVKRSKIARRVPFFTRMEFVKGTSISFADRFNEHESEIKALRIFS